MMDGRLAIRFARFEDGGGEFRLVRRIGIMLCFQAQGTVFFVLEPIRAGRAVEEIAGVKLDSRFRCFDGHGSAGFRVA